MYEYLKKTTNTQKEKLTQKGVIKANLLDFVTPSDRNDDNFITPQGHIK